MCMCVYEERSLYTHTHTIGVHGPMKRESCLDTHTHTRTWAYEERAVWTHTHTHTIGVHVPLTRAVCTHVSGVWRYKESELYTHTHTHTHTHSETYLSIH